MLKKIMVLAAFFIVPFVITQDVRAIDISVSDGVVTFYTDTVLGDSDGSSLETKPEPTKERLFIRQKQNIRVKHAGEKTEIELRPAVRRIDDSDSTVRNKFERVEQVEADRLYMEFEPGETDAAERREIKQEHRDQVRLESKDREGEHQLELESRNIRARLHQGAQFELNSETNEVSLITPSGEQKILNHLPDQAIERMQAAGLFSGDALESELLQVAVNSDTQQLEYRQKMYKQKRLFGLFNRQVGSNVVLNDETGEIHEEQHSTGFARLLDSLSI